jgi:hypothetical protein
MAGLLESIFVDTLSSTSSHKNGVSHGSLPQNAEAFEKAIIDNKKKTI